MKRRKVLGEVQFDQFLTATQASLKGYKPDLHGMVHSWEKGTLGVHVSPPSIPRSLNLLRLVAGELAAREIQLNPSVAKSGPVTTAKGSSSVIVEGSEVGFFLREGWKQIPYQWTEDDHRTFKL